MAGANASPTVADAIVERLHEHGVRFIFGYPGGQITPIYDALYRRQSVRHILARHEQAAAFMADGYARATGLPGVTLAVCGPGVYNAATPLATAFTDSVPVLLLTGQVASPGIGNRSGYYHENEQLAASASFTKWRGRVWFDGEYLLWWTKNQSVPPLVTFSPFASPTAGSLGAPGTRTLVGGDAGFDDQGRNGARLTLGFWLDCERELGVESSTFFLGDRQFNFSASGTAADAFVLARPFTNISTGVPIPDREIVSFPAFSSGTASVTSSSSLWGTELNLRGNLWRSCCSRLDALGGFRFLGLDENIHISENLQFVPALGGGTVAIEDVFGTHNNFYGGQLGLDWECRRGRWSLNLIGKVALGDTHETIIINGTTVFTPPGTPVPFGFLALPSNIGTASRDRFAVVPEAGVKVGYQIRPHIKLTVGYTFLYWSEVARPGDQIDLVVNPVQLAGIRPPPGVLFRPVPQNRSTDFWAQGVSLGLEIKY